LNMFFSCSNRKYRIRTVILLFDGIIVSLVGNYAELRVYVILTSSHTFIYANKSINLANRYNK